MQFRPQVGQSVCSAHDGTELAAAVLQSYPYIYLPSPLPAGGMYIAGGHQISDAACFDHVRPPRPPSRIRYSKKQKKNTYTHWTTGHCHGGPCINTPDRTRCDAMRCQTVALAPLVVVSREGGRMKEGRKNPMRRWQRWRTAARGYTSRLRVQHQDDTK